MKRLRLLVLALLLVFIMASLPAKADPVYFAVVNYTVYPFDDLHRPWPALNDRDLLIPHTVLTGENLGSNGLGLSAQWSPEEKYFTLYNNSGKYLTFVFKQNTAFNDKERFTAPLYQMIDGETTIFFVPVKLVCDEFGYELGRTPTDWGTMIRVRNGGLSDQLFVTTSGEALIKPFYDDYISALPSPVPPTPGSSALIPSSPVPSPSPPELFPVSVYLTFDGPSNSATGRLLDFLEQEGLDALFFLPPAHLADNPAAARRIAARHQIGLLLDEPDEETPADAVRHGNDLLRGAAFVNTWLLRAANTPSGPPGYRYWGYTHRFAESDAAPDIVSVVTPLLERRPEPSVLVLSFPHSDAVTDALAELLPLMDKEDIWSVNPGELPIL